MLRLLSIWHRGSTCPKTCGASFCSDGNNTVGEPFLFTKRLGLLLSACVRLTLGCLTYLAFCLVGKFRSREGASNLGAMIISDDSSLVFRRAGCKTQFIISFIVALEGFALFALLLLRNWSASLSTPRLLRYFAFSLFRMGSSSASKMSSYRAVEPSITVKRIYPHEISLLKQSSRDSVFAKAFNYPNSIRVAMHYSKLMYSLRRCEI